MTVLVINKLRFYYLKFKSLYSANYKLYFRIKPMKNLSLFLLFLCCNLMFAHTISPDNTNLRIWKLQIENKSIAGSFSMIKNGNVYIEDEHNNMVHFPINALSKNDQKFAIQKAQTITFLNTKVVDQSSFTTPISFYFLYGFLVLFLVLLSTLLFQFSNRKKPIYLLPVVALGFLFSLYGFAKKAISVTDPAFMTAAFAQFGTTISTNYDATFFYVNSKGIPNHTMMVGIASNGWQQQVPTSKCYINTNHWIIPLNPVNAALPVPVSSAHFTRGAIAMAVNGVPIFNPFTNTGVDAFTDGQLDNYGGHCGRGDDYHYHTAPLHLISLGQASATLPIAFGLDGYAVYGLLEPTGAAMAALDANHGHTFAGVYHYHGTVAAPYMIGKMVGLVTEDATNQIIPQPQGSPIRTENWGPLAGALITSCIANANNGFNTAYSKNGIAGYATNYTATAAGLYTFQYVTPTGTTSVNYNGPAQCTVPNLTSEKFTMIEQNIVIYPNPATDILNINLGNDSLEADITCMEIFDSKGSLVRKTPKFESDLDTKKLAKGTYFVKITFSNSAVTKRFLIN